MVRVEVPLPGRSYEVLIGEGAAGRLHEVLSGRSRSAILADPAVGRFAKRLAEEADSSGVVLAPEPILFLGGEGAKSMAGLAQVLSFLEAAALDRRGCLVAVGGGSVGDLGGLAAALWLRGIAYVQVPTTLLAMVDSSVGGKTGINSPRSKNAIGAFWQPAAVFADLACLGTLPPVELRSGFGEIVKYAMAMDPELHQLLLRSGPELADSGTAGMEAVIARCVAAKARVVAEDERDSTGARAVLNYGHTVGHALESATGYKVPHGVAVAHGMRAAARIALKLGLCGESLVEAQDSLLARFGLPGPPPGVDRGQVLAALPSDKKSEAGRPRWVLPRAIGHAEPGHLVPDEVVSAALAEVLA